MPLMEVDEQTIDRALQHWRQGDISLDAGLVFMHVANLSSPHSPISSRTAEDLANKGENIDDRAVPVGEEVQGLVILSQTCDVVRNCRKRPFVEVAPLVEVCEQQVEQIRRLKQPAFAYVPAVAKRGLVADLERIMTVEKALIAKWERTQGLKTDEERRDFALALARKRSRFAFPDDFVTAAKKLQRRLVDKNEKQDVEGAHIRALREIRVRATPSWNNNRVYLSWWFIKNADPEGYKADWSTRVGEWLSLFEHGDQFCSDEPIICFLQEMNARDYVESDHIDLDRLSVSRQT